MAVTQYIGARYVPLFYENSDGTSEWRANVIYEPLTIVTWNGNSYTSKKPVPAEIGSPSDNPAYWVATGILNQQIAALSDTLNETINDLDDLKTITDSRFTDRKFVLIGDSYGMRYSNNWMSMFKTALGQNCLYDHAIGSYGFTPVGLTFLQILNTGIAAMTDEQLESVTDVVVVGGWNDAREIHRGNATVENIQNAISAFCARVAETMPNARVHVEYCGWQRGTGSQDGVTRGNLLDARDAYDQAYYKNLTHGCSMFKVICNCYLLDSSNFHPNDGVAVSQLYRALICDLFGSGWEYEYRYDPGAAFFTPTVSGGSSNTHEFNISNGTCYMLISLVNIAGLNGHTIGSFDLASLPFPLYAAKTFQGFDTNGKGYYCILNTNGNLDVYGDGYQSVTSLHIRETVNLVWF